MMLPYRVGDTLVVKIRKLTIGKDGKTYVTIEYKDAENNPTLVFSPNKFSVIQ